MRYPRDYYHLEGKSITEVEKEARMLGLSYGQYVFGKKITKAEARAAMNRNREIERMEKKRRDAIKRHREAAEPKKTVGRQEDKTAKTPVGKPKRPVAMIDDEGNVLGIFPSTVEAAKAKGTAQSVVVNSCRREEYRALAGGGDTRQSKFGVRWRYATAEDLEREGLA